MKVRIPNSGGPGNMNQMLKQAQKMQEDMAALQSDPRRFLEDGLRNASVPSGKFFERFRGKKLTGGFAVRAKFHGRHAASAVMAEGVPEPGLPDPECRASASGSRTT